MREMINLKEKKGTYIFFKFLLKPVFKIICHPKIINKEAIPMEGAFIVCGNHINILDQCGPIISTKRMIHYMAKKEYFDGKFAWFFKNTGCISVNRGIKDEKAKKEAYKLLESGYAVGLFPEGTRNKTDKLLLPFKFGAVSMAKKTGAYIVPVCVTGSYNIKNRDLIYRFGDAFKVDDLTLEEANKKLRDEISLLIKKNLDEGR